MSSLGEGGAAGDGHGLLNAGALVLCGDVDDAVCVDVEGDLNLGHAGGAGAMPVSSKVPRFLLSRGELTLTLEDLNGHGGLVVLCGGEGLGTLGRDCGVALDQLGHHAALGLDTEGEG